MAMPERITEMFAWIITEEDGSDGFPAVSIPADGSVHVFPTLGANRGLVERFRADVTAVAATRGLRCRLVRFTAMEVLEDSRGA